MAVTVEGSVGTSYTSTRSPVITFGASPVEDDIIVAYIGSIGSAAFTSGDEPSGWVNCLADNTVLDPADSSVFACFLYHVVTNAEDTAHTTSWTLTNLWANAETGDIAACYLRGVDTAAIIDAFGSTVEPNNAATHTLPVVAGASIASTGGLVLRGVIKDTNGTYTTPAGHTIVTSTDVNHGVHLVTRDTTATATTDVAVVNITPSGADEYISVSLVFTPLGGTDATATPAAISVAVTIPQAVARASVVVAPAVIPLAVDFEAANVDSSAGVDAVPVAVTIPAVTATGGGPIVNPAAINVAVTMPQATPLGGGATVSPARIQVVVGLPSATGLPAGAAEPLVVEQAVHGELVDDTADLVRLTGSFAYVQIFNHDATVPLSVFAMSTGGTPEVATDAADDTLIVPAGGVLTLRVSGPGFVASIVGDGNAYAVVGYNNPGDGVR
jgi:hypothetical protein